MSFNPKSALIRILEDRPPESNLEGAARELTKATQPLVAISGRLRSNPLTRAPIWGSAKPC